MHPLRMASAFALPPAHRRGGSADAGRPHSR